MGAFTLFLALVGLLPDRGIFPELTERVNLVAPPAVARPRLRVDEGHGLVTLYDGDDPLKVYAMRDRLHTEAYGLDDADRRELAGLAGAAPPIVRGAPARGEDRDGDGIVDRLDVLVGAKKLLANGARYVERYVAIAYPGGDVPRAEGVCSDTVIRALRNAGIDLQREVHEDILRAPQAYPMVEKIDPSINHRRVRTLLPWFARHWQPLAVSDVYRPGDILFFDTFPQRPGPDHIGVVGDRLSPTGHLLIVNNWTVGATDAEMDLLAFVPVTHAFRAPTPSP